MGRAAGTVSDERCFSGDDPGCAVSPRSIGRSSPSVHRRTRRCRSGEASTDAAVPEPRPAIRVLYGRTESTRIRSSERVERGQERRHRHPSSRACRSSGRRRSDMRAGGDGVDRLARSPAPALLNRMSRSPASSASLSSATMSASLVTSQRRKTIRPFDSWAMARRPAASISPMTTCAPSSADRRAVARSMPDAPPVTTALAWKPHPHRPFFGIIVWGSGWSIARL